MFADDTKVSWHLETREDPEVLQCDLDKIDEWSNKWLLTFNVEKFKIMHIGKNNPRNQYNMTKNGGRSALEPVSEEKDLGITLDEQLTFQKHIEAKTSKANQMLGIVKRTFRHIDKDVFLPLYKALVRPHLEYGTTVWSPLLMRNKRILEQVQCRATKLIPGLGHLPYPERLIYLGLPTLEYQRLRADMVQTYKLTHGLEKVAHDRFFTLDNTTRTRGHAFKITKLRTNTYMYANCFRHRIVVHWNNLPAEVVEAPTLNCFKSRLNHCWKNHQPKFTTTFNM